MQFKNLTLLIIFFSLLLSHEGLKFPKNKLLFEHKISPCENSQLRMAIDFCIMYHIKNRTFMLISPQCFKAFKRHLVIPSPLYTNVCYVSEKMGLLESISMTSCTSQNFLFIPTPALVFSECLLCARDYSRPRGYTSEQSKTKTTIKFCT